MTETQALYIFKGKRVLVARKLGTVVEWSASGTVRVKMDNGLTWIGPIDELADAEKGIEPMVID